uniref:Uncharacterized protein n=1 Tax=Glossina brevipalpis TaxID=37001 RepID=A0A1A9WUM0_9MUSC
MFTAYAHDIRHTQQFPQSRYILSMKNLLVVNYGTIYSALTSVRRIECNESNDIKFSQRTTLIQICRDTKNVLNAINKIDSNCQFLQVLYLYTIVPPQIAENNTRQEGPFLRIPTATLNMKLLLDKIKRAKRKLNVNVLRIAVYCVPTLLVLAIEHKAKVNLN